MGAHTVTKQSEKFKRILSGCQKADGNFFLGQERSAYGGIHETRDDNNATRILRNNILSRVIHNKRRGMLTFNVVLPNDNACPHTAACTRALLEHFNWELFDHPPYSPDLSPSDYHLFTYLKNWLGSQSFDNIKELMEGVKTWLSPYNSLTQAYTNLFPDTTNASVPAVSTLKSSLSMYVFFVYNNFFS
jgi:transposase